MAKKFLSTADASKMLGVTPAAVRLMVNGGRLKATAETEGGIRLFTRREVERVLRKRESAQNPPGDADGKDR
jgi:DNA-binding transcriptional MerR regulator